MIRIRQVKVPVLKDNHDFILKKICKLLNVKEVINYKIIKKSIDARDKNNIMFVYEFDVNCLNEDIILNKVKNKDVFKSIVKEYKLNVTKTINNRPIIVGSGPAGLFCAYMLSSIGLRPIIVERGEKIEDRVKTVEEFFKNNKLNLNSNIQFGEGGAGTFSDGKLNTLTSDKNNRQKKVFDIFYQIEVYQ